MFYLAFITTSVVNVYLGGLSHSRQSEETFLLYLSATFTHSDSLKIANKDWEDCDRYPIVKVNLCLKKNKQNKNETIDGEIPFSHFHLSKVASP